MRLGARLGLAKSPFPSADARDAGLLTSVLLEGEAQVGRLAVRLRLPLVLAGVDQPAGGAGASTTWGHPEAALLWRPRGIAAAWLLARLALAVPLPSGGEATLARRPLDNQALVLASAQRQLHDQELYAPGRVALTPSARLDVRRGPVALFGEVKLPFMLALAGRKREWGSASAGWPSPAPRQPAPRSPGGGCAPGPPCGRSSTCCRRPSSAARPLDDGRWPSIPDCLSGSTTTSAQG